MSGKISHTKSICAQIWAKATSTNTPTVINGVNRKFLFFFDVTLFRFMTNAGFSLGDNTTFGILYSLILLWIFQGIGIVSDIFME
jgi:hypothetical protein